MSSKNLLLRLPAELRVRIYHHVLDALPEEHGFAQEKFYLESSWGVDVSELNCFASTHPYLDKRKAALVKQGIQHFHGRLLGLAATFNAKFMMEGLDPAIRSRMTKIRVTSYSSLNFEEAKQFQEVVDMDHVHPELQIEFCGPSNLVFVKSERGKDPLANGT
ncbi:hypothetical protein LTS18_012779 [Coniosporium uncinatum]|uniref:Uncharacterized protein n=1 Tax=Coniosporium uncinatum TaxID=93489 RepID=A0ACC3CWV7_9PEZI|nr:hypothetical protein LTS18_012779 [Coniosporium uncinatum]